MTSSTSLTGLYYTTRGLSYKLPVTPGKVLISTAVPPIACPATGYYWNSGNGDCVLCPAGSACPDPAIQTPISCPAGTYAPQTGMADCLKCPAGYSCTGGAAISACADGYYSLDYSSTCTQCPAGYYCPTRASYPLQCAAGHSSTVGALACEASWRYGYPTTNMASMTQTTCAAG